MQVRGCVSIVLGTILCESVLVAQGEAHYLIDPLSEDHILMPHQLPRLLLG